MSERKPANWRNKYGKSNKDLFFIWRLKNWRAVIKKLCCNLRTNSNTNFMIDEPQKWRSISRSLSSMVEKLLIMTKVSSYKVDIDSTKVYEMEDAKRQGIKSKCNRKDKEYNRKKIMNHMKELWNSKRLHITFSANFPNKQR